VPKFHLKKFNLKMLKNMEMKEHYWVKISNRYATLENFG
jgi:hypothetical protein